MGGWRSQFPLFTEELNHEKEKKKKKTRINKCSHPEKAFAWKLVLMRFCLTEMQWHSDVHTHFQRNGTEPVKNAHYGEVNWCNWKSTVAENTTTFKVIETKQQLEAKSALPNKLEQWKFRDFNHFNCRLPTSPGAINNHRNAPRSCNSSNKKNTAQWFNAPVRRISEEQLYCCVQENYSIFLFVVFHSAKLKKMGQ